VNHLQREFPLRLSTAFDHRAAQCLFINLMEPRNIQRELMTSLLIHFGLAGLRPYNVHMSSRALDLITISSGICHHGDRHPHRPPPPSYTLPANRTYLSSPQMVLASPTTLLPLPLAPFAGKLIKLAILIWALPRTPFRTFTLLLNLADCRNEVSSLKDASRSGRGAKFLCGFCRNRRKGLKVQATYCDLF